jgi:hypothetical protein
MGSLEDMSEEELARLMNSQPAHSQQVILAQLQLRQSAKSHEHFSAIKDQVSKIHGEMGNVKAELKTLEKSHRIHLWILVVAIVTAGLALIAALDVVLKWFPSRKPHAVSSPVQPEPAHSTNK